ncbi:TIGR03809 family protein [Bradyrhizobium sp. JYMT SZCCT0428]|uniref:TIGR03809 family protein n=1 Tax=Bradyrhizobium sp. JYMT SZCCT0428 TaxID=2807673 RepID=UPI001BAD321C|nr:TIGR03809 family protein [Bradyrhizobium sp. JYMT SZCCT0428]MBR1151243.1 TIGR03809 family protein [Bradyrhizobium sp. JYMT SZCCT0428]
MTHHADVARGRDIVARWCNLAEQRLDYLTELFETGRWRRFHTEDAFLENIREAKEAVELWRKLETREASLDNTAVDLSWLGRRESTLTISARLREYAPSAPSLVLSLAPVAAEPPRDVPGDVLIALESVLADSAEAPSVPDAPALDDLSPPALDLDAIRDRYPLLRNAL